MTARDDKKLDNPVWHSLCETHKQFAIEYADVKFYLPDYCPFGAFISRQNTSRSIDAYSALCDNFFIVGERPDFSRSLKLENQLVCLQMVMHDKIKIDNSDTIKELGNEHTRALYQLVNWIQPGYFKPKTPLLGTYYGIFSEGQLVAVAGERMQMSNYVELSAVVTHPSHTGRGYAKQLVPHAANQILGRGKTPYLHVAESNMVAVNLYQKLGFSKRRSISFWKLGRVP